MKKFVYVVIILIPSFLYSMDTPQPPRVTISKLQKGGSRVRFPNSNVFEVPASDSVQTLSSKRSSPTFKRVIEQSKMDYQVVRGKKLSLEESITDGTKK